MTIDLAVQRALLPGRMHDQGIALPPDLTFAEWVIALQRAEWLEQTSPWFVVDIVAYGEARFGEDASQAWPTYEEDPSGARQAKLKQALWMASKFPPGTRVPGMSFTHHRIVAKLDRPEAVGLLQAASEHEWSTRDLAQEVRIREHAIPAASAPVETTCAADAPVSVADLLPEWRRRAEAARDPGSYLQALIDTAAEPCFSRWID